MAYEKLPDPISDWEEGVLKCFNQEKDFGFIDFQDGTAIILGTILRRFGLKKAKDGDALQFRYGIGEKGLVVVRLRPPLSYPRHES